MKEPELYVLYDLDPVDSKLMYRCYNCKRTSTGWRRTEVRVLGGGHPATKCPNCDQYFDLTIDILIEKFYE